jgi:hypothetical protein
MVSTYVPRASTRGKGIAEYGEKTRGTVGNILPTTGNKNMRHVRRATL